MISVAELSHRVSRVSAVQAQKQGVERDDDWYLIKLQEELGELARAHLRLSRRGPAEASETDRADEAADVLCQLLLYCRRFGIDVEEAVNRKWMTHLPKAAAE
jgi:NTP pyrophosphatase (non-canonical NTP hydrolase)